MPAYTPHSALIVVDVQNDFADPRGSLYVRGGEEVIPLVNAEVSRALAANAFVVYTQDWHPAHTPHFQADGGIWPEHCVQHTWGAAFHPTVTLRGPTVRKGLDADDGYSGFSGRDMRTKTLHPTTLESLLREHDIEDVVIVGLAMDYCVFATALDAAQLGFHVTVLRAATRAVELMPGDGARAVDDLRAAGIDVR